jgi:uncharacterized protein (TIGR02271 family)
MATTLVGIFDRAEEARRASAELSQMGIEERMVKVTSSSDVEGDSSMGSGGSGDDRGFFAKLFGLGDDDEQSGTYAEAVRRGGYVVTVHLDDESQADRVADILENAGAIDVRNRMEAWRAGGYSGYDASAGPYTQDQAQRDRETLQVMQEEIRIGKRAVEGGGVRVHRYTTERPVSEELQLHEERVFVDRRPVDRPATQAELDALGKADKDIELREMSEEAVVSKTARVVEEVEIGKEARDRTERIEDTVRRTDVDVERIDPQTGAQRPNPQQTRPPER